MTAVARGQEAFGVPASAPLEAAPLPVNISVLAEHESWRRERHRPATYVHKWWARRLGTVVRGVLQASTDHSGHTPLSGAVIYEPFAGSGTTLVEAVKLGARVIGRDINPVATLTQRQALQAWDLGRVECLFKTVTSVCATDIANLYVSADGDPVLHYFWVAVATCPTCDVDVELFSTHVFSKHAYPARQPIGQATCPACHGVCPVDVRTAKRVTCPSCARPFALDGPVRGRLMTCPSGHATEITTALARQAPRRRMYAKMVKTVSGDREYRPIDAFDLDLYDQATQLLRNAAETEVVFPEGDLIDGASTTQALRWGYRTWASFFNDRQLYCLGRIAATLRDLPGAEPEREALAAAFGKTVEHHNVFCSFKGEGTGPVRSIFHNHVLRPERCSVEGNPWGEHGGSGGFHGAFDRIRRAHEYKVTPKDLILDGDGRVQVVQGRSLPVAAPIVTSWDGFITVPGSAYLSTGDGGATDLPDRSVPLVITDPPYVDNVHYSELADFFHAWLRCIRPFPEYPTVSTTRDPHEVQNTAAADFRCMAAGVWRECSRVLTDDGLLAFSFHQSHTSGWKALMQSLHDAELVVTATWPVVAEVTTSLTKLAAAAPNRIDVIVVCRKSPSTGVALTPSKARDRALRNLTRLRDSGLDLGVGDVLSATRAAVLALGTRSVDPNWDLLARKADHHAMVAAAKFGSSVGASRPA